MSKVIDYVLVWNRKSPISDVIKEYLDKGWELYGSPFASGMDHNIVQQAMVKRETEGTNE